MSWDAIVLLIGGVIAFELLAFATAWLLYEIGQRRRRNHRHRDAADALEAWSEPIPTVWPNRAPRNGDPFGEKES